MNLDRLESIDERAEVLFDHLRGHRVFDAAAVVLSNLADYGFVWVVLAAGMGRRPGAARKRAARALALSGMASAGVNTAVKRVVKRERPAGALEGGPLPVRPPSSASFPSGHTLAAFSTAVMLPESPAGAVACLTFATAVAASRVHLRAHHASDVLGGAVIGMAIGAVGRRILGRRG